VTPPCDHRLASTILSPIFLYDLAERRAVYVNNRSAAVIGYTAEEIVEMGTQFLRRGMHPDDLRRLDGVAEEYARAKDGEVLEHVCRFRHKNGEWRWIHRCAAVFARAADGRPTQILGTVTDVTASKKIEQELQRLATGLLNLQDDERRRIATELHGGIAQILFGISATVASLRPQSAQPPAAAHALAVCQQLCDEGIRELRMLSYLLHPPLLDEVNLIAALRWFAEGFSQQCGIDVQLEVFEPQECLPPALERHLFRIAQEALGNVARHSGSHRAVVRLNRAAGQVVLQIQDFGCGMPSVPDDDGCGRSLGVGILGIRERLRSLGGRLDITSTAGGTTVTATAPLRLDEA
jgi:PAS domain S-box-containing protein